ncbi:MAG: glycosyltransferase family 39 protein [Ardenticatenaceae bacterium]|nr:glycosyltransferase family 39 protein [Ardenticatenaceae bacterium]
MKKTHVGISLFVFIIFVVLYLGNISGWLMHDDEGTDFYEVWQLQEGKQPGKDYVAEQQPLFLLTGAWVLNHFGHSPTALRFVSAVQVLAGALIFAWSISRVQSTAVALTTFALTLSTGLVYEQARLFRPDPMMLGWELAGLGIVILAAHKKDRRLWLLAGFLYGIAFLWKPFGVLPLVGLILYFADQLWCNRYHWPDGLWRGIIGDGFVFGIVFLLIGGGVSVLLYNYLGFYYQEVLLQHSQLGQQSTIWQQVGKVLVNYLYFLVLNPIWLLTIILWRLQKPSDWRNRPEIHLMLWQLASPLFFLALTRPLFPRYIFYLTPVFAFLLAWQIDIAVTRLRQQNVPIARLLPFLITLITLFISQPGIINLFTRQESDTLALAKYVAAQTAVDDSVLSDYAGINFFANRHSIYEASIIAGGRIQGQIITGEMLINRIESDDVQMVLLHVAGGEPQPHQLIELVDYHNFRAYLETHFTLIQLFDRAGQQIEIYKRK